MVKPKPIQEEKKRKEKDYRILPVRKEEDFVKMERELPEPFKPIFEKNGAAIAILGGMGSGKGNLLSNWFLRDEFFKDLFMGGIYFISPTAHNDLTNVHLVREASFVETEYSDDLMKGIYDNIMDGDTDDRELSAIILDDCLGSIKQHSIMNKITSTVRHMKSLLVYSLQALKGLPPTVRSNISATVVFHNPSTKQMSHLLEAHANLGGEENWLRCYEEATSEKYGFLYSCFKTMRCFKWGGSTTEPILLWQMYDENGNKIQYDKPEKTNKKNKKNIEEPIKEDRQL